MPSIAEILKQTGFTDEEIAKVDPRVTTAFTGVMSAAEQERKVAIDATAKSEELKKAAADAQKIAVERAEKAELVERSNREFYEGSIVPALTGWDDTRKKIESEKIRAVAEAEFYKKQAEGAKANGFIAADAPAFTFAPAPPVASTPPPPGVRDSNGRYVANVPGSTPGSPTLIDDVRSALSDTTWAMGEYQRLHGGFLPDDPMQLAREAEGMKLPYRDYVSKKYNFAGKRDEIQRKAQEDHDAAVRADSDKTWGEKLKASEDKAKTDLEKARTEWAERTGNNPDVRTTVPSEMREVNRAVQQGNRPDPLKLSNHERHQITRKQITERIATQEQPAA
jgi:hypothetical protein